MSMSGCHRYSHNFCERSFILCVCLAVSVFYYRPDLIQYDQLSDNPMDNLCKAFQVAEQKLGLPQILDPKGILL